MDLTKEQIERFWNKVDIRGCDDCWEWKYYKCKKGYGIVGFRVRGIDKLYKAHRVSLSLHSQYVDGMHCLHSCDNPSCCNPNHLKWGTNAENMRERNERNPIWRERVSQVGKRNGLTKRKLTIEQADEIRKLAKNGFTQSEEAGLWMRD